MKISETVPGGKPPFDPSDDARLRELRGDRSALEAALTAAGASFRGRAVLCPFHADAHPSGSIFRGADGAWRFRCHGCGVCEDVIGVRALSANRTAGDVLKDLRGANAAPAAKPDRVFPTVEAAADSLRHWAEVEAVYRYVDPASGRADLIVFRCREPGGGKTFRQASPVIGGGFVMRRPAGPLPLYNRAAVAGAKAVVVVEGEKCVEVLAAAGVVATTSPMGAGKAAYADWSPLAGRDVVLWPDNDPPGVAHMREVADLLGKLSPPPRVRKLDPSSLGLPEKGDAADVAAAAGGDAAALRDTVEGILAGAVVAGPAGKVRRLIEDTISGRRSAVPWPWPTIGRLTNALMPGMVTALCGDGGSTKTYFLIQSARYWHDRGIPFAFQALEEHEDGTHLMRALVQQSVNSDLLEMDWIRRNPDEARDAQEAHADFLESFGSRLWAAPGTMPTLSDLTDWVRDRVRIDKCRVVCIDPVTAADGTDKPWADDKRFIRDTQTLMLESGASLVLVTHPKKGAGSRGPVTMDDLAGGAAYQRHTQTVLWLKYLDEEKEVRCKRVLAGQEVEAVEPVNRIIRVFKASNGRGRGMDIGYHFGAGMLFCERGVVIKGTDS